MPNGGSDCCGICWFNSRNREGAASEAGAGRPRAHCEIRGLDIARPFWTYCANHPHRSPERDRIPIGPVWVDKGQGREIWQPAPDNEEVRGHLLDLVAKIEEQPASEYPIGIYRDELVVWQLGELRERQAIPQLQRIAAFRAEATDGPPFNRTRQTLVRLAAEALARIQCGDTPLK